MSSHARTYRNLYGSAAWEGPRGMRKAVLSRNSICQRIEDDGEQCRRPARDVHHLIDHEGRADKFFDWATVAAVCKEHHPSGPGDPGHPYVPTIGLNGEVYEHKQTRCDGMRVIATCNGIPIYGR